MNYVKANGIRGVGKSTAKACHVKGQELDLESWPSETNDLHNL